MANRSLFKPSSTQDIKESQKRDEQQFSGRGDRAGYHTITEGDNIFRLYPAHPNSKSNLFCQTKVVSWLPIPTEVEENGKKKTVIKQRPVFNSRAHGSTEKDIVEEYINFVKKNVEANVKSKSDQQSILAPFLNYETNPAPRTSWVAYADKYIGDSKEFKRLEIIASVKYQLNNIASAEETDGAITLEPFTDVDEGRRIKITFNKSLPPKDKYKTALMYSKTVPLTDEDLDFFEKQEPLEKMFVNVYKKKDFELALIGLKTFDEKYNINAFEEPEWLEIVEEIAAYYENEVESEQEEEEAKSTSPAKVKTQATDIVAMDRVALKNYIKERGYEIVVVKSMSDEDIRQAIKEVESGNQEEKEEEEEEKTTITSLRDRLKR